MTARSFLVVDIVVLLTVSDLECHDPDRMDIRDNNNRIITMIHDRISYRGLHDCNSEHERVCMIPSFVITCPFLYRVE